MVGDPQVSELAGDVIPEDHHTAPLFQIARNNRSLLFLLVNASAARTVPGPGFRTPEETRETPGRGRFWQGAAHCRITSQLLLGRYCPYGLVGQLSAMGRLYQAVAGAGE